MKNSLLFCLFFYITFSFSQYNPSSPWMKKLKESGNTKPTLNQIVTEFDQYWLTHDKNERGSGHKPFKRWENHWRNKVDPNGHLITPKQMWDAFNSKKLASLNRSASVPTSIWEPIGPFTHTNTGSWSSGQGRVNVVYVDPSNANTIYIGTPAGGIWKSTTSGTNWVALSDNLPQIGVSGIAVDPTNSNTIYISTGDCDGSDSYSIGVMKSLDGGVTWNTTGLSFSDTNTFSGDIMIHPTSPNIIFVATSIGIYKSSNSGTSWTTVAFGDFSQGRIRFKPNDPTILYAVSDNRFYRSINTGSTFTTITSGLPSSSRRLLLDVTPADANLVYILSADENYGFQGVYKSTNGGTSFVSTNTTTNVFESPQAGYDLAFAVSPTNANEIYTGCLNIWRSTNGGVNFSKRNNWSAPSSARYTHADIHYLRYFGNKLYCGSDGGVYVSDNNSTSFSNLTASAQISQFYKIAVSKQSASKMMGGLQDNGGHAFSNNQWKNYFGADGMDTAIDPINSNLFYGFIQYGGGLYISNNAGNSSSGGISAPNNEEGLWVTPLVSNSLGEIYAGYTNLYKLSNGNWSRQNQTPMPGGSIYLITIDPNNNNIIYMLDNIGLMKSTDKGLTFTYILTTVNEGITSIAVHSASSNIVYITTGGTEGDVLKSTDGGLNFTSIGNGLPNIGKNIIVHQGQNSNNPLFVGTSLGVYYRDDTMSSWQPFDANLPNVSVTDLDINLEDAKITAATYGRGVWQANIEVEIPANDLKIIEITNPSSITIPCTNGLVSPQFVVKNGGLNPINTINITYSYNTVPNNFVWNGVINPSQSITISLPEINLPKDFYNLTVNASIPNDQILQNNSNSKSFAINGPAVLNQVNTFETEADKLLAYDDSGLFSTWQRGVCTTGVVNTGTNKVYASNLTNEYGDNRKAFLTSGCYDLTQITNPVLSFKMAYDLELNFDIVYLQYTIDNGQNWFLLGDTAPNWYTSDRTPNTTGIDCQICVGGQWTGTNTNFIQYSHPLNLFTAIPNVIFRIVFHSDGGVTQKGVIIDDFVISGSLSNQTFELKNVAVYPNPSKGLFTISAKDLIIDTVEVFDLTGKNINYKTNATNTELDLNNVANGVYFVKITSNNLTTTKKIIKN